MGAMSVAVAEQSKLPRAMFVFYLHMGMGRINSSEVVLCPILYCIDVFSTYLGEILDFVVVHWSFIFVSHVSRLIVEFI
jgi:hypothetical protein